MQTILYARNNQFIAKICASCFEELQFMFRFGIQLPGGQSAFAIGECTPDQWEMLVEKYTMMEFDK